MVFLVMIFFMIAWIPLQVAVLYSVYYHTAHDYGQVIIIIRLMITHIFESFIYLNFLASLMVLWIFKFIIVHCLL